MFCHLPHNIEVVNAFIHIEYACNKIMECILMGNFMAISLKLLLNQTTEEINNKSWLMWCTLQRFIYMHQIIYYSTNTTAIDTFDNAL